MYFIKGYEVFNLNNIVMLFSELKDDILLINIFVEFDFKIDKFEKIKLLNNLLLIGKLIINDVKIG